MKKLQSCLAILLFFTVLLTGAFPARAAAAESQKPYLIKVNKKMCTVTVYKPDEKGNYTVPVKSMLCSTGANTPLGTFKTPAKYRWRLLMGDVWGQYCTRIVDGILFHSVWYYEKNPATLSNRQFNNLGKMVSHGCIRLNVEDVKWIYDNCPLGTTVTIYNSDDPGPLGKPKAIKVSEATQMGYDPTDIWSAGNPYIKKKPTISGAKNKTISYGTKKVKLKETIKAKSTTGEDITSSVKAYITFQGKKVKKVDTKTPGKYKITYKVTDALGKSAQKSVVYTVVDNAKPKLTASGSLYWKEEAFTRSAVMEGVTAKWHGESYDLEEVTYQATLEEEEEGLKIYKLIYTLEAPNGKKARTERSLYIDTEAPLLEGVEDKELAVEYVDGVLQEPDRALLTEDLFTADNLSELSLDDITVTLEPLEGEYYKAVYTVEDEAGNTTVKEARLHFIPQQSVTVEVTGTAEK